MKDKEKQSCENCILKENCFTKKLDLIGNCEDRIKHKGCQYYQPKLPEDSVVLSREEYDELINLQRTHAEDLTNAIQSHEESKAELKIEYNNHIKSLEKTIDRQSKDLNSQADRLIDLKAKLEQSSKETAEKIYKDIRLFLDDKTLAIITRYFKEILGVEIKD